MSDPNQNRPGYKETKVGWIPEEWDCSELLKVAIISRGRFSHRPRNDPRFYGGGIPFVQTGDVSGAHVFVRSHSQTLNMAGLKVSKTFEPGVILMTIAANIGDCAILRYKCACPDSLVGIEPKSDCVHPYYLSAYLNSIKRYYRYLAPRSSQHNVNVETISEYSVPVPPFLEQKKIAEILSTCDEVIEKTGGLIDAKKRQKKALMQQLLTGKKRLPGFEGEWVRRKMSSILSQVFRAVDWAADRVFNLVSVRRRSLGLFRREPLRGDQYKTKELYELKSGDFLVSKRQVTHGALAMVTDEFDGCHVSKEYSIFVNIAPQQLHMPFFDWLSRTRRMWWLAYVASNGVVIEKLIFAPQDFLKFEILLPPTAAEQAAISDVLNACEEELVALEAKAAAFKELKKALMQKLLTGQVRVKV